MLRAVVGVRIAKEIFGSVEKLRVVRAKPERGVRRPGGHRIYVAIVGETRVAMIVQYGDLANLLQHAIVGLLVAGLRPQSTMATEEERKGDTSAEWMHRRNGLRG